MKGKHNFVPIKTFEDIVLVGFSVFFYSSFLLNLNEICTVTV